MQMPGPHEFGNDPIAGVTAGTLIQTADGARPIEKLHPGDRVLTYDAGMVPVRGIGRKSVSAVRGLRPVRIAAGALGNVRELILSPDHRVMWSDWRIELLFGTDAVLIRAGDLVGLDGITSAVRPRGMDYFSILLAQHHLVMTDCLWGESQQLGVRAARPLSAVDNLVPSEIARQVASTMNAARYCLRTHEAEVLKSYCRGAARIHVAEAMVA